MKRVLIILGSYFPKPSANGICVKQVVNELKSRGVKVTIIANKSYSLEEFEVIDDIEIYRIKMKWLNKMIQLCDDNKNKFIARIIKKIMIVLNKMKNILFFPLWPLTSPLYSYRYYKKAKELHKKNDFNGIISIYTPIDTVIAGSLMKKKYKDIKFMIYFLDTLSGGIAPKGFSKKWLEKRGYSWDKKLLKNADNVFIMKSHTSNYLKEKYNEFRNKIKVVDIPLMRQIKIPYKQNLSILSRDKTNIVYTGSLLKHVRSPDYMLKIFENINSSNYVVNIFGGGDCNDLLNTYTNEEKGLKMINHGMISYQEANNAVLESDILINIGNLYGNLVPSKIFEYISSGKPIISFFKYDTEPSIAYLEKYPLSLLIKEDWDNIQENKDLIVEFINNSKGKILKYEEIKNIFQDNTPRPIVDYILDIISNTNTPKM